VVLIPQDSTTRRVESPSGREYDEEDLDQGSDIDYEDRENVEDQGLAFEDEEVEEEQDPILKAKYDARTIQGPDPHGVEVTVSRTKSPSKRKKRSRSRSTSRSRKSRKHSKKSKKRKRVSSSSSSSNSNSESDSSSESSQNILHLLSNLGKKSKKHKKKHASKKQKPNQEDVLGQIQKMMRSFKDDVTEQLSKQVDSKFHSLGLLDPKGPKVLPNRSTVTIPLGADNSAPTESDTVLDTGSETPSPTKSNDGSGTLVVSTEVPPLVPHKRSLPVETDTNLSGPSSPSTSARSDDEDDDQTSAEVASSAKLHLRRRRVLRKVLKDRKNYDLELAPADGISEEACAMFEHQLPEADPGVLRLQQGVQNEVRRYAAITAEKGHKKDPYKVLRKVYKIPKDQDKYWSRPREVPDEFLQFTNKFHRVQDKKLNVYVHKESHINGKLEKRMLNEIASSQLCFKMTNCLSLSIKASQFSLDDLLQETNSAMSYVQDNPLLRYPDIPQEVKDEFKDKMSIFFSRAVADMSDIQKLQEEASVNATDINKWNCMNFIKASTDRRRLWVENSQLSPDQKFLIQKDPVVVPTTPKDEWHMFSEPAKRTLRDWRAQKFAQAQLDLSKSVEQRHSGYSQPKPQFKAPKGRPKQVPKKPDNKPQYKSDNQQKPTTFKPKTTNKSFRKARGGRGKQ
jgi:hypothetical protein